jgi:uncharacterized protein HemX
MKDFKQQIVALLLVLIIGGVAGAYYMSIKTDDKLKEQEAKHKQELKNRVELALKIIEERDSVITALNSVTHKDSLRIISMEKRIEADGVRIKKLITDINKLSPDEKVDWLINRYK